MLNALTPTAGYTKSEIDLRSDERVALEGAANRLGLTPGQFIRRATERYTRFSRPARVATAASPANVILGTFLG